MNGKGALVVLEQWLGFTGLVIALIILVKGSLGWLVLHVFKTRHNVFYFLNDLVL